MLRNLIEETCNAPGTGSVVNLLGAVTGRLPFIGSATFASGDSVFYFMHDGTQSEWGYGAVTSGSPNTLARTTVIKTSAGGTSRLNFTGLTRVYCWLPAEYQPYVSPGTGGLIASAAALGIPLWGGTSGGSANAQTVSVAPALTALLAGTSIRFIAGFSVSGAATLNVSGLGAVALQTRQGAALLPNRVRAGGLYEAQYDGTAWRLTDPDSDWEIIDQVTLPSAAEIDFTLPSWPTRFRLEYEDVLPTVNQALFLRFNQGAGFLAGPTAYYHALGYQGATSSPTAVSGNSTYILISAASDASLDLPITGDVEFSPGTATLKATGRGKCGQFATSGVGGIAVDSGFNVQTVGRCTQVKLAAIATSLKAGSRATLKGRI
jgi:hypothetical protein